MIADIALPALLWYETSMNQLKPLQATQPREGPVASSLGKGLGTLQGLGEDVLVKHVLPRCIEDQFLPGFSLASRRARALSHACALGQLQRGAHAAPTLGIAAPKLGVNAWFAVRQAQQFANRFVKPPVDLDADLDAWVGRELKHIDAHAAIAAARVQAAWRNHNTSLDLSGLGLRTLPDIIGVLLGLNKLDVSGNRLQHLPHSLTWLRRLEELDVSSNQLCTLPSALHQLKRLKHLFVFNNALHALPDSLDRLSELVSLNAHHNQIDVLPARLPAMTSLRMLAVSHNHLTALPRGMGHLQQLESLWVDHNRLQEIDPAIALLPVLRHLVIDHNPLLALSPIVQRRLEAFRPAPYRPPSGGTTRSRPWFDWFLS